MGPRHNMLSSFPLSNRMPHREAGSCGLESIFRSTNLATVRWEKAFEVATKIKRCMIMYGSYSRMFYRVRKSFHLLTSS